MNSIYQIIIPVNINDLHLYNKDILVESLYNVPAFDDQSIADKVQINERLYDMSSCEPIKKE